ncbi:hypothetical protein Bca52824_053148 [Brassica carinata]|uniref:Agenet-like domain-containing protein n=1 Tax=Brassica carinata TaxID=52824 RepID=A0A8X7R8G0_BRACI|nr:hypothetical protein Bca52824_053148 [Brassica carinata]
MSLTRLMAYLIMELDLTSNILTSFGSGNTDSFVRWHPSCCRLSQRPEKDQSLCRSTTLLTTNSFWRGTCQELSKQLPYTRLARSFFLTLLSDSRFVNGKCGLLIYEPVRLANKSPKITESRVSISSDISLDMCSRCDNNAQDDMPGAGEVTTKPHKTVNKVPPTTTVGSLLVEIQREMQLLFVDDHLTKIRLSKLKVTCILPPIPHDPEDDVSMEDEHSDELESVKDISKKGYKFKADDWKNRADVEIATSVGYLSNLVSGNVFATNLCDGVEKVAVTLVCGPKRVTVTADKIRPKPPADDRENKFEMMDNVEAFSDKGWSSGQVENDYGLHCMKPIQIRRLPDKMKPIQIRRLETLMRVHVPIRLQDTKEPMNETISQNILDTQRLTRARAKILREQNKRRTRVQTHFDVGANVEIVSKDEDIYVKWYPGIVLKTDIRNGVGMLKVEYSTRFRDKEKRQRNFGKCVHSRYPSSTTTWRYKSSTEFIKFNLSDLRIPKEWVDGVWKMEKERKATAHPVDHAKKGKLVVGMKRKATAQPVDRLAFLQREKKRPIVPRNPPMPVTPEVILPIDPFVTPEFPLFSRLGYWMQLCGIHYVPLYINGNKIEKYFFEYLDNAENNLKEKGWVGEVVRGLIRPNKMWMQDVDIVYGVVHERLVDHFIGVEIHLMENTITIFHCGVHKVKENPLIQKLAVKKAKGSKTKLPFNCGLFVVKMLECRSLGLKKMSSINDDTAMDLRSKLCCEMFDQFMDKDFQEGCRRMALREIKLNMSVNELKIELSLK